MFEPQTPVERSLALALSRPTDGGAYRNFVQGLVGAVVGVLGTVEPHGFQPLAMSPTGTSGVCVFTHPARYDTFTNELMLPAPNWEVRSEPARKLFGWAAANDLFVLLNPGSDFGKEFPPFELDRLLRGQWV